MAAPVKSVAISKGVRLEERKITDESILVIKRIAVKAT